MSMTVMSWGSTRGWSGEVGAVEARGRIRVVRRVKGRSILVGSMEDGKWYWKMTR
jgi:hypothetical protein